VGVVGAVDAGASVAGDADVGACELGDVVVGAVDAGASVVGELVAGFDDGASVVGDADVGAALAGYEVGDCGFSIRWCVCGSSCATAVAKAATDCHEASRDELTVLAALAPLSLKTGVAIAGHTSDTTMSARARSASAMARSAIGAVAAGRRQHDVWSWHGSIARFTTCRSGSPCLSSMDGTSMVGTYRSPRVAGVTPL